LDQTLHRISDLRRRLPFAGVFFVFSGAALAGAGKHRSEIVSTATAASGRHHSARIFTKRRPLRRSSLQRDFNSLWNTGYFDDLRIEREESPKGYRIHVYVKEKPTIRSIEYKGLSSVSQSDVLERFKQNKLGSPSRTSTTTKVKKAEVALRNCCPSMAASSPISAPRSGYPPAQWRSPSSSRRPQVKVGKIKFEGNKRLSSRELRRA